MYESLIRKLEERGCRVKRIREFETPATKYPSKRFGEAEIVKEKYKRGLYLHEGVGGYDFFFVEREIPVTKLRVRGETVMVDDPLHWEGMKLLGKKAEGRVLTGGLGLGLIAHALAKNPRVKEVTIVERNKDVRELVKPLIPDEKIRVCEGNILDDKWYEPCPDTVILDLWTLGKESPKEERAKVWEEMMTALAKIKYKCPNTKVWIWGLRNRELNPAVEKEVCEPYEFIAKTIKE